jgi:hypothetical protein
MDKYRLTGISVTKLFFTMMPWNKLECSTMTSSLQPSLLYVSNVGPYTWNGTPYAIPLWWVLKLIANVWLFFSNCEEKHSSLFCLWRKKQGEILLSMLVPKCFACVVCLEAKQPILKLKIYILYGKQYLQCLCCLCFLFSSPTLSSALTAIIRIILGCPQISK